MPTYVSSRGFAFVVFDKVSTLNAVLAEKHTISEKVVDTKKAIPHAHHQVCSCVCMSVRMCVCMHAVCMYMQWSLPIFDDQMKH